MGTIGSVREGKGTVGSLNIEGRRVVLCAVARNESVGPMGKRGIGIAIEGGCITKGRNFALISAIFNSLYALSSQVRCGTFENIAGIRRSIYNIRSKYYYIKLNPYNIT
jgi:hypothetical protein